ncbi:MAG: hypothetical protein F4X71_01640 [Cenarchaeum sp. SB0662_bin_33]|nr:hypothetical protein [Cenarchaeum sp. SB0662_bin_33]
MTTRLPALSGLLATLLLLAGTTTMGLLYGTGLYDRVVEYLDVVEGELLTVSAIQRDNTIDVRANFKHVLGAGMDRLAVSELILGDGHIELVSPLTPDYASLTYTATGWTLPPGCTTWNVVTTSITGACDILIHQRINGYTNGLLLSDGAGAVLEVRITTPRPLVLDSTGALVVEFGNAAQTSLSNDAGVSVYTD